MLKNKLLLALLALTTGLCAQDNAAAPADSAKLTLAREAIAAMHADKMFDGMVAQMKQLSTQMTAFPPDATPEQRKKGAELQGKIMDLSMASAKAMIAKMDEVYAEVYSEAELKAMKAFFTSPEGESMIAKQPQVMARVMPMMQEMQRTLAPQIQKLVAEAKAETAAAAKPAPASPVTP